MIFVDTNVLYSILVKTKFSESAQDIIQVQSELATSATVLGELVYVSLRKLCKERYGTNNYPNSAGPSFTKATALSKRIWI